MQMSTINFLLNGSPIGTTSYLVSYITIQDRSIVLNRDF